MLPRSTLGLIERDLIYIYTHIILKTYACIHYLICVHILTGGAKKRILELPSPRSALGLIQRDLIYIHTHSIENICMYDNI